MTPLLSVGVGADDLRPFSLRTSNWTPLMRSPGFLVLLMMVSAARRVVEAKGLHLTRLDEDGFWGAVQHKALHGLDLPAR